jgi:Secretion system C-terminal sorting domain
MLIFLHLAWYLKIYLYICFNQIIVMSKKYLYITLLFLFLSSSTLLAQEGKQNGKNQDPIEGLSFYPNPVSNGKIYITTKYNEDKQIIIFDVLGKKVLQTLLTSKELNISTLSPGVYIIKIEEGDASATRKLIVR